MYEDIRHFTLSPIPLSAVSQPGRRLFEKEESETMVTKKSLPADSVDAKAEGNEPNTPRLKTRREKDGKNKSLTRKDFLITELTNMSKQSILDTYDLNVRLDVKPKFYQQFARKRPSCKQMFPYLALKNRPEDCWRTSPNGKKTFDSGGQSRTNFSKENFTFGNDSKSSTTKYDRWRQSDLGKCTEFVQPFDTNDHTGVDTDQVRRTHRDVHDAYSDDDNEDNYSETSCASYYTKIPTLTDHNDIYGRISHYSREDTRSDDVVPDDNVNMAATSIESLRNLDTECSVKNTAHNNTTNASVTSLDKYWKSGVTEITERDLRGVEVCHTELINNNNDDVYTHLDRDYIVDKFSQGNALVRESGKDIVEASTNDRHHIRLTTKEISTSLLDKVVPIVDASKPLRKKSNNAACRRLLKLNKSRAVRKRPDHSPTVHVISEKSDQNEANEDSVTTRTCSINDSVLNYRHKRINQKSNSKKSNETTEFDHVRKLPTKTKVTTISSTRKTSGNLVVDFESVRIASHLHRLQKHASVVGTELGYKTSQTMYSKCWNTMKGPVPVVDERGFRSIITGCAVK